MARILTVTANPLLDFLAPEFLEAGKVTRSAGFAPMAAGKGINVARVLVRHGHQATACFFAGGATGQMVQDLVTQDGIDTLAIRTASRLRVGFICAGQADREQGALLENGFAVQRDEADELLNQVSAQLGTFDLVMISGSVPDPQLNGLYVRLGAACAAAGVPCWIDSYGAAMDQALAGPHPPALSKPNRQEYAQSTDWQRVEELHITDGGASTEVRSAHGHFTVIPPAVSEVNPVGSGDCYVAGLIHGRLSGWDVDQQLAYAAACGAANAARWDVAQIAAGDDLHKLARHTVIKALR